MSRYDEIRIGSIVQYGKREWVVYDWCPPCGKIYVEMWGEKKIVKYSEVKLLMY